MSSAKKQLTPEQEAQLTKTTNEWNHLYYAPGVKTDEEAIRNNVDRIYQIAGLDKGPAHVLFADSPLAAQFVPLIADTIFDVLDHPNELLKAFLAAPNTKTDMVFVEEGIVHNDELRHDACSLLPKKTLAKGIDKTSPSAWSFNPLLSASRTIIEQVVAPHFAKAIETVLQDEAHRNTLMWLTDDNTPTENTANSIRDLVSALILALVAEIDANVEFAETLSSIEGADGSEVFLENGPPRRTLPKPNALLLQKSNLAASWLRAKQMYKQRYKINPASQPTTSYSSDPLELPAMANARNN